MKPSKRIARARLGAQELHAQGLNHKYTPEQASAAAKKRWDNYRARKVQKELDDIKVGGTD